MNYDSSIFLSIRTLDGHYYFGTGEMGIFPGFLAAWRISEENFMKSILWLTQPETRHRWANQVPGRFAIPVSFRLYTGRNGYAFGSGNWFRSLCYT